jgi:hypothetical protein
MKTRLFAVLVVCLALVSCERVKQLIEKAKGSASQKGREMSEESSPADIGCAVPMDADLVKLMDKNEEGIRFRRDLPFPKEVRVSIAEKEPMTVRLFQQSEVGKKITKISAVRQLAMEMRRTPSSVQFANFKEEYFLGKKTDQNVTPGPIKGHALLPPVPPRDHTMVFRNGTWGGSGKTGFAEAALAQQLGPHLPALLQEYGLSARPMWFGKRRIAPGKPMEISGELLPMLVAGKATGALTITLEQLESVHGHPCGRFAIKGSYQRKGFPFPDGRLFDEETSIQSGHIWMSVLHPLVLQYRVERIVTLSVPEGSGPAIRFQGNTSSVRSLQWSAEG